MVGTRTANDTKILSSSNNPPPQQESCNFFQTIRQKIFSSLLHAYRLEMGTVTAEICPEAVQDYLDETVKFEMEPDFRFQDYDFLETKSLPSPYSKRTAHRWAFFPCYPCCCCPCKMATKILCFCCCYVCCCRKCCDEDYLCSKELKKLSKPQDDGICGKVNKCKGGLCCMTPTLWDFIFESNRSRVLALWNLVLCMLLLFTTLNPISSIYEKSPGCENAFSFRPGILAEELQAPVVANLTDLVERPHIYCNPMNMLIALERVNSASATKDHSLPTVHTDMIFSGSGEWSTCSALYSASASGYSTSFNLRIIMLYRILFLAAANSRSNRLHGWGFYYAIAGGLLTVLNIHDLGRDLAYCPLIEATTKVGNDRSILYGDLDRVVQGYVGEKEVIKGVNVWTPELSSPLPTVVESSEVYDLVTNLSATASFSKKWIIPAAEIKYLISQQCMYQQNHYDLGKDTRAFECTLTYPWAKKALQKHGFYEATFDGIPLSTIDRNGTVYNDMVDQCIGSSIEGQKILISYATGEEYDRVWENPLRIRQAITQTEWKNGNIRYPISRVYSCENNTDENLEMERSRFQFNTTLW